MINLKPGKVNVPEKLFRFAAVAVFVGMGLRGLLHDLPLRALFWDAKWWTWFAELFGFSWKGWVTSAAVDRGINVLDFTFGLLFLLVGFAILRGPTKLKSAREWLGAGSIGWLFLLIQYFLNFKESFWQIGNLIEHAAQMGGYPLWVGSLALIDRAERGGIPSFLLGLRLLIVLTFVGHGLYAVGVYPVPANFVLMTQAGLGVGEETARSLLLLVGILDFMAAFLLLLPWRRAWRIGLGWILPWAVLTTLARLWSYGGLVDFPVLLAQWLPEFIIRLPHILLPLALLNMIGARPRDAKSVFGSKAESG